MPYVDRVLGSEVEGSQNTIDKHDLVYFMDTNEDSKFGGDLGFYETMATCADLKECLKKARSNNSGDGSHIFAWISALQKYLVSEKEFVWRTGTSACPEVRKLVQVWLTWRRSQKDAKKPEALDPGKMRYQCEKEAEILLRQSYEPANPNAKRSKKQRTKEKEAARKRLDRL